MLERQFIGHFDGHIDGHIDITMGSIVSIKVAIIFARGV
jgi:hypothetical protein